MGLRQRRHCRRHRVVAALAAASAVVLAGPGIGPASARQASADDGLRVRGVTSYRLDPAARLVHVAVDLSVTNTAPDSASRDVVRRTYFPEVIVPVPVEATNVTAVDGRGRAAAVRIDPVADSPFAAGAVDLSPDLYYPGRRDLRLTYDLPDLPPRSEGLTRVNPAFSSVVAVAVGDPGLADVEVVVPPGYDVDTGATDLDATETATGDVRYSATAIADPDTWAASVVARNDDLLEERKLRVDEHDVVIHAWPGDRSWADFVTTAVRKGLPLLADLVDRPWPIRRTLHVTEAVIPYTLGYAGVYRENNTIEVHDVLDAEVVLHELSHIWFNSRLFTDRWISEGLAQQYASLALDALEHRSTAPLPVDPAHPGRVALNAWSLPNIHDEVAAERERYGYNASWAVLRGVVEEIGEDAFRGVVTAAGEGISPYAGDDDPGRGPSVRTWRYLLDLLEEQGRSVGAAALFRDHVVTAAQAPLLDERAGARATYGRLVTDGHGWTPPAGVRQSMTAWRFPVAERQMRAAHRVLALRDDIARAVEPGSIDVPPALEVAYEGGTGDLVGPRRTAERLLDVADDVVDARRAADGVSGIWAAVGSWGGDPDRLADSAVAAFEDGDAGAAHEGALAAQRRAAGVERAGQRRVGAAAGLTLCAAGGWEAVRRRRRRDAAVRALTSR